MRELTKGRVISWLERHFFVRLHMTLILSGTALAGVGATAGLLALGVTSLPLRYALAVCAAYLAFLTLIRLWLAYVGAARGIDIGIDGVDWARMGSDTATELAIGDGQFGGAGATGSWGESVAAVPAKGSGGGSSFDIDLDGEGLLLILLFLALVFSLIVIGVYAIYSAPALLGEAAFEALLAGALARRARKVDRPGWMGVVWRATVWPFILVLLLSIGLGWAAQRICPDAQILRDAIHCDERQAPANR